MTPLPATTTHTFGHRDPSARGYYGAFGGAYVPETLVAPIELLTAAYDEARRDPAFRDELDRLLRDYVGRPTPLWEAARLGAACGGARIFLKREDLTIPARTRSTTRSARPCSPSGWASAG